jgi:hypothetical protein
VTIIELFHLRRVRNKPLATALLEQQLGLSAEAALALVHQALGGAKPRVTVAADARARLAAPEAARRLIVALADTGFIARRAPDGEFDAARHADQALARVLPRCAPSVADAAATLLLQGDWMPALALAVQHLQMHRSPADAERWQLECVAIDCGLVRGVPGRV